MNFKISGFDNSRLYATTAIEDELEFFVQGRSRLMARLLETLKRANEVDAGVLLVGSAGTGKKMVARGLHEQSPRRHNKFVAVNCSSISEEILERDLFGHETFALGSELSAGKLASAQGGTIYLDKIDGLPLRLQDRLLDILQQGNIKRPGSYEPRPIDIRIIAATKEDLKIACARGGVREDLFYRLSVIQIVLPPLKDRLEDIPLLFQHFALKICAKYHRPAPLMTRELFQELLLRDWLGNVRQLKNVAERFALGFGLDLDHPVNQEESTLPVKQDFKSKKTLVEKMNAFEKNLIAQELARTNGNVKTTYLALGLPRKTFYDKMHKHGLKRKDFLPPRNISDNDSTLPG